MDHNSQNTNQNSKIGLSRKYKLHVTKIPVFFVCYCEGQDHGGDDDVDGGGVAVVIPTLPFRSSHHHSRDPEDGQNQREH